MEFFKAFFLVLLFAASSHGLVWWIDQPNTNMFSALGGCLTYVVAFSWVVILVGIGLEEGS